MVLICNALQWKQPLLPFLALVVPSIAWSGLCLELLQGSERGCSSMSIHEWKDSACLFICQAGIQRVMQGKR